jgi:hypothetical protein
MIRQMESAWRISNLDLVTRGAARANPGARKQAPAALRNEALQTSGLFLGHTAIAHLGYVGGRLFSPGLSKQITQVSRPFFDRIALLREIREAVIDALHSPFLVVENSLRDFVLDTERG